jgi:hypothetical protein
MSGSDSDEAMSDSGEEYCYESDEGVSGFDQPNDMEQKIVRRCVAMRRPSLDAPAPAPPRPSPHTLRAPPRRPARCHAIARSDAQSRKAAPLATRSRPAHLQSCAHRRLPLPLAPTFRATPPPLPHPQSASPARAARVFLPRTR